MALQLAYNLWQYDRQTKNVDRVIDLARKLYDKTVTFRASYEDIRDKLVTLQSVVDRGYGQLAIGNGNLIGQIDKLRGMGVTPKKQLEVSEPDGSDDAANN